MEKKDFFVPIPLFLANIMATFFQILPNPLITRDQIKLLFYHNIFLQGNINKYEIR